MPDQNFKLKPSYQYLLFLSLVLLVSFVIIFRLEMVLWMRALLLAILTFYGVTLLYHTVFLRGQNSVKALRKLEDGKWLLTFSEEGSQKVAELANDSVVTGLIAILRFKLPDKKWPISCIIFMDSLPPDQFRQLRILIKS